METAEFNRNHGKGAEAMLPGNFSEILAEPPSRHAHNDPFNGGQHALPTREEGRHSLFDGHDALPIWEMEYAVSVF
jgi:hypothetical protein